MHIAEQYHCSVSSVNTKVVHWRDLLVPMNEAERLKRFRRAAKLTQSALAAKAGLSQSAIGNIESGIRGFGSSVVALAQALDISPSELLSGEPSNVKPLDAQSGAIPLISWIRAGEFCESPDNFSPGDAEDWLPRPLASLGRNAFALEVTGESMDVPDGYRHGDIVYINPDLQARPGNDVVAKMDVRTTLKRYRVDTEGPYLLQLNGNIIIRPTLPWEICGVVVFSGRRR